MHADLVVYKPACLLHAALGVLAMDRYHVKLVRFLYISEADKIQQDTAILQYTFVTVCAAQHH